MRSANGALKSNRVSEMAGRDWVSAEKEDGISMESSVKESVMERENENSKVSDGGLEKDNISQEEEGEQSFETHSDTGVCNTTVVFMTGTIVYNKYTPVFHFVNRGNRGWKSLCIERGDEKFC